MKNYMVIRVGKGISYLLDKRIVSVSVILVGILMSISIVSIGLGEYYISPQNVIKTLFMKSDNQYGAVIFNFRLPRIIMALFVGMSLAAAGVVLQAITRNPLASPDTMGLTSGAAMMVLIFLAIFSTKSGLVNLSITMLPFAAFIGSTLTFLMVYILAYKNGLKPLRLILIGVGISAIIQAIISMLMLLAPINVASKANIWISGTMYATSWKNVMFIVPWASILLVYSLICARKINVHELGDDISKGLGFSGNITILILLSSALTAGAVAFTGTIAFVGLIAPHIARKLVGSSFEGLLLVSILIGAIIVILSDVIGRVAFSPFEVPAGIFTAILGASYFLYLLCKKRTI